MKENDVKPRTIFVGLDLYYSQEYVDKLQTQLQQKENIIKEVREYINENEDYFYNYPLVSREHLLEILDKENK